MYSNAAARQRGAFLKRLARAIDLRGLIFDWIDRHPKRVFEGTRGSDDSSSDSPYRLCAGWVAGRLRRLPSRNVCISRTSVNVILVVGAAVEYPTR